MIGNRYERTELPWKPGTAIELRVESYVVKGVYPTTVIASNPAKAIIHITFPMDNGKLVFIPVGIRVTIHKNDEEDTKLECTVIDRVNGDHRCLVLQAIQEEMFDLGSYEPKNNMRLFAVASGKGGVGKTTFTVNMALALAQRGMCVCILDGDLGTANVDVVLNLAPRYNIAHVISGQMDLLDTILEGPKGIKILPGCSGIQQLTELGDVEYNRLALGFDSLSEYIDIMIIDTPAGLSRNVTNFVAAAGMGYIITTPEPHALTDAYALLKVLVKEHGRSDLKLVVNRVESEQEALRVAEKVQFAAKKFLHTDIEYAGFIYDDSAVRRSLMLQEPLLLRSPRSGSSKCIQRLADQFIGHVAEKKQPAIFHSFLQRMKNVVR